MALVRNRPPRVAVDADAAIFVPLKMRRHLAPLALLLALPFAAWGQAPVAAHAKQRLSLTPLNQVAEVAPGVYVPLWRSPNGRVLALVAAGQNQPAPLQPAAPQIGSLLDYRLIGASSYLNSGLKLDVTPQTYVRGGVTQTTWSNIADSGCVPAQPGVEHSICLGSGGLSLFGTEVGAGYSGRTFGLDLSLGLTHADGGRRDALPQIVPQLPTLVPGLPAGGIDGSSSLNARGQVLLGDDTHLDIGAGIGRVRVLPQLAPGADSFDSKTLSLGLDRGPLSGNIVGRMLEPSTGASFSIPGQRWTAIDLGVTLRLPWQGELSIGAQNVWSSGTPPLIAPGATAPEQTRVPYVQYHQDL